MGYGNSYEWAAHYEVLQCDGCGSIAFRKETSNSEDLIHTPDGNLVHALEEHLYPSPDEGRAPVADSELLPRSVQRIYSETLKALNSDQPILSGMGIRALVETVCKERKATGRLEKQIDHLVTQGILTKEGAEILHRLRVLGNVAAHDAKPHGNEPLSVAMNVIDHLLQGVYILPVHAKKSLPKRNRRQSKRG